MVKGLCDGGCGLESHDRRLLLVVIANDEQFIVIEHYAA